jgi:hypothetical protein
MSRSLGNTPKDSGFSNSYSTSIVSTRSISGNSFFLNLNRESQDYIVNYNTDTRELTYSPPGYSVVPDMLVQLGGDIDGEAAGDRSGRSVSMNAVGNRVAIGANFSGSQSGSARVYNFDTTTLPSSWVQLGGDIDGEAVGDRSGMSVSMNAAGDRVAIGAPRNDGSGVNSGSTRVYQLNTATSPPSSPPSWVQLGGDIDGEASDDQSGTSVSLNAVGDRVAIGAPFNDGNGSNSGSVRVYALDTSNVWVQLGGDIDGEAAGDLSGYSVSMNAAGDRVAIGAPSGSIPPGPGSTRVYILNTSNAWVQLGGDIDGESADQSGVSVSLNAVGDRVAIGANDNNGNGPLSGTTRVYQLNTSNIWVQLGSNIDGEAAGDRSGTSVSMNAVGDRVAIGAIFNANDGVNSGSTRLYEITGSNQWVQLVGDINGQAAGDQSGISVSMNAVGDRVAIGANFNANNGVNSGSTRVYLLERSRLVFGDRFIYFDVVLRKSLREYNDFMLS